jgi:hypothetical protein
MGRFDKIRAFLKVTHAMGMGTRDAELKPEYSRVLGGQIIDDEHFMFFLDKASNSKALNNLEDNKMISLVLLANTFQCYQLKGRCSQSHESTSEEVQALNKYMDVFNVYATGMGFRDGLVYNYPHSTPWTVTMRVEEIFEQTPKAGTGNKI